MTALLTPVNRGTPRRSGASLWRKQLLPIDEIDYKGRKIVFDREYLAGLAKAFNERAYDRVPFQIADGDNKHTNDPYRRAGWVNSLEVVADGLDIIVAANEAGAALLEGDGRELGISARIVEDYQRADGKFFPAAVQHVLGTLDPRIPGMRPWQPIDAANDDTDVIDLTAAEYASAVPEKPAEPTSPEPVTPAGPVTEEPRMARTEAQEARLNRLLDLPDEKFDALLADPEPQEELTDADLEALLSEIDDEAGEETEAEATAPEGEPATAGAALSADAQAAIDLANSRAEENALELANMRAALDLATYEKERDTLARVHGIPPRITDLARPLLEGSGRTIDLANGRTADAGSIMRKVLAEVGKTVKMLDLSAELGTPLDSGATEAAAAEERKVAEREDIKTRYGQMAGLL